MKKTDWTDRMLAALVELYPVETTAYTAAVLNLSESTVKLKARELGLVKMAKSRWMERADYIRNHFQECSFSEIGKALDITRMSVGRIAAAIGLKRSSEEKHLISSRIRTQMVKRERRRIVFGLEPITGIRVISNRAKVRVRSNMKSNGYIISEEHNVIYYTMARSVCRRLSPPAVISSWVRHVTRRRWSGHRMMCSERQSRLHVPFPSTTTRYQPQSLRRWTFWFLQPRLRIWQQAGWPDRRHVTLRLPMTVCLTILTSNSRKNSRPQSISARRTLT